MNKIKITIKEGIECLIKINNRRLMEAGIKISKIPRKKKSLAATRLLTPKKRGKCLCNQS